ncbi:hypothetical protein ACH5RR_005965 [Cinchona calisaya]|uniref:OVATE domain-containing protein n=1 Tax=Cinchona calisaya TaxID=153742 RepID=A0ABD3AMX6_9GENT
MLLRTAFSNTKKFFQKTVESFKSFLSGGYERLPKNSPCSSFPCGGGGIHHQLKDNQSYKELDKVVYTSNSTSQIQLWDVVETEKQFFKGKSKKKSEASTPEKGYDQVDDQIKEKKNYSKKKKIVYDGKIYENISSNQKILMMRDQERRFLVAKKLKELEMLDNGNVEHVLDIEEVLHYYSRLTCPAYVDIVDKFFMDMYSELFNGQMLQRVGF